MFVKISKILIKFQRPFERISYNARDFDLIFRHFVKIRPYNDRDFDPSFVLIMFDILTQIFDISTKISNILNMFKNLPQFSRFWSKF